MQGIEEGKNKKERIKGGRKQIIEKKPILCIGCHCAWSTFSNNG